MDLLWHAHMSYPAVYQADMLRIALRRVGHDDSINDRCAADRYEAFRRKNAKFRSEFGRGKEGTWGAVLTRMGIVLWFDVGVE
jgi:hypothetical protein